MRRRNVFFVLLIAAVPLGATGLSTPFADVSVGNVPLGTPFSVSAGPDRGLLLLNPDGDALDVDIQVLTPAPDQLRGGAAPVPDRSWIEVRPSHFRLNGHERRTCEIVLKVPKERRYRSRYYQAMIWSRGTPVATKGVALSAGLLSRLRFETARR